MLGELVAELLGPGGGEIRYEAPADDDPLLPRAPSSKGRAGAPLRAVGPDGRYELLGRLNGGGQAVLWAARDTENLRLVAVKTTSPHLGAAGKDTDAARRQVDGADARLRRELEILRSLKRVGAPHVMPLLDGGPGRLLGRGDDGAGETARTWLALPLLPHVTLADLLRRHPQGLPEDAAWEYTRDLARALDALHEHDDQQAGLGLVVHRDLSPGNVLATPAGVYVADFGMAWSANLPDADVAHTTGLTGLHGAGATAGWVAPERLRPETGEGPGPVPAERDPAGDVFAWGLHAFSALTGRHPWAAYDPTGGRLGFHHHVSEAMRRGDPIDLAPLDSYDWTAPIRHALTQERTARMEAQKAWKEELLAPGRSPTQRRLEATRERERSLQGHFLKLIDERSELGRQLMEQEAAARSEQQGREAAERAASTQERELRRRDALLREAGVRHGRQSRPGRAGGDERTRRRLQESRRGHPTQGHSRTPEPQPSEARPAGEGAGHPLSGRRLQARPSRPCS